MNRLRAFFASRAGRLVLHDGTVALGVGVAAWDAAGQSWTWGAATAAAVVAGKAFLRLILPVPAAPKALPSTPSNSASFTTAISGSAIYTGNVVDPTTGSIVATLVANPEAGFDYRAPRSLEPVPYPAHTRLTFLPKPSGRKGGLLPSPRDDRDYKAKLPGLASIPASRDYGAGITWGMLLNDRIGDCYPAALLHALQLLTGYTPVDADALAVYEQVTGYDPTKTKPDGSNPTDQGTYGRQLFDWARRQGLIASYAAVPANRDAVKAAIVGHKAVLCEWALPVGAETEGDVWTMPRKGRAAGSWGGHATVECGYTPKHNLNVTWGEYGTVTPSFEDAYLTAAWVITVAPGTKVADIMAKVRAT